MVSESTIIAFVVSNVVSAVSALNNACIEFSLSLAATKVNGSALSSNRMVINNFAWNLLTLNDKELQLRSDLDALIIPWSNLAIGVKISYPANANWLVNVPMQLEQPALDD
jgi:hypothetical protein